MPRHHRHRHSAARPPIRLPVLLAALLGLLALPLPGHAQMGYETPEEVIGDAVPQEGDILAVGGRVLRLYGIDAPELGQPCRDRLNRVYDCGAAALNVLTRFVTGRELTCQVYGSTIDGLETAICIANNTDIGGLMVRAGWAFSYRHFSDRYEAAESNAQSRHRGFWEGRVQRPWVWRTQQLREGMTPTGP